MPVSITIFLDNEVGILFEELVVSHCSFKRFQAYHSSLSAPTSLCKMALLPLNTKFKGPAPQGGYLTFISKLT